MRLKLFLVFLFITSTLAEVLEDKNHEDIDPIQQTQHESEDNDQSKRFLFDENRYAFEKHVKYHNGQKHLLGYRPVRLQYLPVARPIYYRPMKHYRPMKQHAARPVVSLVPPKVNPNYKPYNTLPVNVPPHVPERPWQNQGWDAKPEDKKPFVPSTPVATVLPTVPSVPVHPVQPLPVQPLPVQPTPTVFPTNYFIPKPVFIQHIAPHPQVLPAPQPSLVPLPTSFPVQPVHTVHPVHSVHPVHPVHPAHPVHPVQPVHPVHPIQPVHPVHHVHPVNPVQHLHPIPQYPQILQKPLVPINFLPGKLNIGHPDLGVLPLGATAPVQLVPQAPTAPVHLLPQAPNVVHKQILVQEPHLHHHHHNQPVFNRLPEFHPNVQLQGGFTPIENPPQHHHHVYQEAPRPVLQNAQPIYHQHPHGFPQPGVGQQNPQVFQDQPVVYQQNFPQPSQPLPGVESGVREEPHNYFYFAKGPGTHINSQIDFNQQAQHQQDFNQQHHNQHINSQIDFDHHQHQLDFSQQQHDQQNLHQQQDISQNVGQHNINYDQNFEQPSQHQGYDESAGYYQPGKTDLQIPDYLPDHPHLRNNYQDQNYEVKRR